MVQVELKIPSVKERVEAVLPRLKAWGRKFAYCPQDAEDLAQDVALKIMTMEYEWKGWESFFAYVYQVIKNTERDTFKKRRIVPRYSDSHDPEFGPVEESGIMGTRVVEPDPFWQQAVEDILNDGSSSSESMSLYLMGYSPDEVAEKRNVSRTVVYKNISKARRRLAPLLGLDLSKNLQEDIAKVTARLDAGENVHMIAAEYHVTLAAVRTAAQKYRKEVLIPKNPNYRSRAQCKREFKQDRNAQIMALVEQGVSKPEIARRFGISKQGVYEVVWNNK